MLDRILFQASVASMKKCHPLLPGNLPHLKTTSLERRKISLSETEGKCVIKKVLVIDKCCSNSMHLE